MLKPFLLLWRVVFRRAPVKDADETEYAGPEDWLSIDLVYQNALRQIDAQVKLWEQADDRLRTLLGYVGLLSVVLGATGQVGTPTTPVTGPPVEIMRYSALIGLILLVITGGIAGLAYLPRDLHYPPKLRTLREDYLTRRPEETKLDIVDELIQVYDENQIVINQKLGSYRWAQLIFLAAIVLLACAIAIRLFLSTGGSVP